MLGECLACVKEKILEMESILLRSDYDNPSHVLFGGAMID